MSIKEAIERVDGPAGVVVLMDLGSAVLSAELALDLLEDPSVRDRVTLSAAPIVEGLIVAAVAAAGGAGRAEVAAEARGALIGKAAHLSTPDEAAAAAEPGPIAADEIIGVFTVENHHGLHARPASRLVSEVRGLDASVQLRNLTTGAGPVPAGSLSRVATLGAMQGHEVEVRASGPQAQEAVEHLLTLARRRFDEPEDANGVTWRWQSWPRSADRFPRRRDRDRSGAQADLPVSGRRRRGCGEADPRSGGGSSSPLPTSVARPSTFASSPPERSDRMRQRSLTPT